MLNYNNIINKKLYNNILINKFNNNKKYKDNNIIKYNKILNILNINICLKDINYINTFNFYPDFYKKINNLNISNNYDLLKHYLNIGCFQNYICNTGQIYKWFPDCNINNDNIIYNNNIYNYNEFINLFIYNKNYHYFLDKISIYKKNIVDSELIILLHIGNFKSGIELLKKLINNNDNVLAVNINNDINDNDKIILNNIITSKFINYIIFNITTLGNDIIPTLMMYKYLKDKIKFKYILKIHTKSKQYNYNLTNNIDKKIEEFNNNPDVGVIANAENVYNKDKYNNELINHIYNNNDYHFIAGTMFYIRSFILDKVFNYKNIIKASCLMSFYFNNKIFKNSPIHSLERIITMECENNNYKIFRL